MPLVAIVVGDVHAPKEHRLAVDDVDLRVIALLCGFNDDIGMVPKALPDALSVGSCREEIMVELEEIAGSILGDVHVHAAVGSFYQTLGDGTSRRIIQPDEHVDDDRVPGAAEDFVDPFEGLFAVHVELRLAPPNKGADAPLGPKQQEHAQPVKHPEALKPPRMRPSPSQVGTGPRIMERRLRREKIPGGSIGAA